MSEVGTPTQAQAAAWPRIAAGEHVLVSAPTGSGKTLTAFLWAVDRLLTGEWSHDRVRVLYISPLRALNTDIRRNLQGPLAALKARFEASGRVAPRVTAMTRSGDTSQADRRKMRRHPPEILVTTPESLNILLTSRSGREMLGDLKAVILDEIHAIAASKRGTHLITAVDRLVELSGEFQRIALSATVKPMEVVAEFMGGFELTAHPESAMDPAVEPTYRPRQVAIVRSTAEKIYDVRVRFPVKVDPESELDDDSMWEMLTRDFRKVIRKNRSTLLFANSRRMTEKATRLLNLAAGEDLAYSHHGSLSREVRSVVEKRLKQGELKAIVATNSLELGIDVGELDEVLLIQTPPSVASAVQRIGRAGHGVGQVSRGRLYPTFGRDLLESAVVARAVTEQDIEEIRPVVAPLDVLAQVILSMVALESRQVDGLFHRLRASWPYRQLSRRQFDLVLDMLSGRYAQTRIRELRPRVHLDRVRGTVKARPGVARLIYMSGGTIADRGYFSLRMENGMAKIGELDEEFVWERSIGDSFMLGTQSWKIRKITHNDVLVVPGRGPGGIAPFWRADARDRSFDLCQKIAAFLERAEKRLTTPDFLKELEDTWRLEPGAAKELVVVLDEQRTATGGMLPRRDQILVEKTGGRAGAPGTRQVILHTYWGGAVNRPLAMALQAAWDDSFDDPLEVFQDDCCLLVRLPEGVSAAELLALVPPDHVEELLRRRLEGSGFFGARFRWAAGTALLLPRSGFRQRMPLWLSRQRSKKLLETVRELGDFPMVVEAWRTCLYDEFELDRLKEVLTRVRKGEIGLREVSTQRPSPLAAGLVWQYTNQHMYEDDTPAGGTKSGLRQDILSELVHASHLRPALPPALVERFRHKTQRLERGYAPAPGDELLLWIHERLRLPAGEWRELLQAVVRDHGVEEEEAIASVWDRVLWWDLESLPEPSEIRLGKLRASRAGAAVRDGEGPPLVEGLVAVDAIPRLAGALGIARHELRLRPLDGEGEQALERLELLWPEGEAAKPVELEEDGPEEERPEEERPEEERPEEEKPDAAESFASVLAEWLRYYGPISIEKAGSIFGRSMARLTPSVELLAEAREVVLDELTDGAPGPEICDAENLEILLRWLRTDLRPNFEPRPGKELPLFFAAHQGLLAESGEGIEGLQESLERLFGLVLPAELWESDVLPARLNPYYPAWLDSAMQQSELMWLGLGKKKVTFAFDTDLELLFEGRGKVENGLAGTAPVAKSKGSEGLSEEAPGEGDENALDPDGKPTQKRVPSVEVLIPSPDQRLDLGEIAAATGLGLATVHDRLWELAWESEVTCDTWLAVRQALGRQFSAPEMASRSSAQDRRGVVRAGSGGGGKAARQPGSRAARWTRHASGWRSPRAGLGRWRRVRGIVAPSSEGIDAIDDQELIKDRVRLLLGRYGLLFRELLLRELPAFRWAAIFRTARLMELSGELLAGYFFHGIRGLQLISHGAFQDLQRGLPRDSIYWLNASDPASLCGVGVEGLQGKMPKRIRSTHLVYHGTELVLVSRRRGKALEIRVPADHPRFYDYLAPFETMLTRESQPLSSIRIESINGEPAGSTDYAAKLGNVFRLTREGPVLRLWKRY